MFLFIYLFISPRDLRAPSTDRRETLPHDRYIWLHFIMQVQNSGALHQKYWVKNMQNLGRFHTTAHFDREYLQKESSYPK